MDVTNLDTNNEGSRYRPLPNERNDNAEYPTICSWGDIYSAAIDSHKRFTRTAVWYRGHGDSNWQLIPKIHREGRSSYEASTCMNFWLLAPGVSSQQQHDMSQVAWLGLMQHHGLPTRLLDWSESLLIACYFAVTDGDMECDSAVWALDPVALAKDQFGRDAIASEHAAIMQDHAIAAFGDKPEEEPQIVPFYPRHVSARIRNQQGVFTSHSHSVALENTAGSERYLQKYIIPAQARKELLHALTLAGFNESYLFPSLDKLATWLSDLPNRGERDFTEP